jgi:hypothetical protein
LKRHVNRKAAALLALAALPVLYLGYAFAQRQASRPRRADAPSGAQTITVKAGDNLQRALDAARPGDEVVLDAGAVYVGNFVLPVKAGESFVTVRSSRAGELAAGRRVTPADAARMARVATPNSGPAFLAPPNSHHWRLIGLEVTQSGSFNTFDLIQLGDGDSRGPQDTAAEAPRRLTIDRCYLHAFDDSTTLKRGIALNSAQTEVVNSHISGVKAKDQETHALGGWNGPGPFTIENNYLEAAGVNIMFGGATAAIPNLVPSDITIKNNYIYKPLSWKGVWQAKNLLELKSARRVTITGNVLENSWPDSQTGWGVIFNVLGEYGPASVVEDVGAYGGEGKVFQLLNGTENVRIDHNTVAGRVSSLLLLDAVGAFRHDGLAFTNNLGPHGSYGVFANGGAQGTAALEQFARRWSFAGNVIAGADANRYPARNFYPTAFGPEFFADSARGNYRFRDPRFKGGGTDGRDPGCDFDVLGAATAWFGGGA